MDVFDAIRSRRSIGRVKDDPVDKNLINKILEAGTWAPNHFHTEPWRFFVLTGEGRKPLGRTLAEISRESMEDPTSNENQIILRKQEEKVFRAPVIITCAAIPSSNPKVKRIEEIGAVNAAIQNMLLTVHSLGLGAIWRTGAPCYHPLMKKLFGLSEEDEVLGFIYLGYVDNSTKSISRHRTPFEEKTVWMESDS
ncbi:nitroreductase [Aquibacillus sp. 3ASR75-11]|uniref:Putative NAD(P)H nitroreductase n=1 Tax=Terrihalobacillus insolitus TaxID=2950438 RepID=A0A9X4APY6_9BACI|nr:nitroreductase [Terrihalobacillus insolitus]MDC3414494.1 nitroreductase [Terrihalobacillus insolitus]MDC3426053.1 nitroreductase [Terrihalobacillus insolitus]